MSTARRGVTDHQMAEWLETAHQRFTRLGIAPQQALRISLYMSFRLSGEFDSAQAWEAVDSIVGPQQQTTNQRRHNAD